MKENITYEELHKHLNYNKKTGIFIRLIANAPNVDVGDVAGFKNSNGYIEIGIDNKYYKAHRLAWLYVYGYLPESLIDHEDQIRHHNWISNLRESSKQCNARNSGNPKNNTSGVKGVHFKKHAKKWVSYIKVNYKKCSGGYYKSFDNAVCARLALEQSVNWSGCDSSSPAYKYVQQILKEKIHG